MPDELAKLQLGEDYYYDGPYVGLYRAIPLEAGYML